MTPPARLAAAIEVLDLIADSRASADAVLRAWGRGHRFAGSGDRRAIGERVYACLRGRARFAWRMGADNGRALLLGALADGGASLTDIAAQFTGEGHAPATLNDAERTQLQTPPATAAAWVQAGIPEWLVPEFERAFGHDWIAEAQALLTARAPVDLRVNTLEGTRGAVQRELKAEPTPWSALGLRLPPETDVQSTAAFQEGRIEIQDESSQIAAWLSGVEPGMTVVDYCAGGGGKTLALATLLNDPNDPNNVRHPGLVPGPAVRAEALLVKGSRERSPHPNSERTRRPRDKPGVTETVKSGGEGRGTLIACDIDRTRLDNIKPRLIRAGVTAELRQIGPDGQGT